MSKQVTFAVIGFGIRGREAYSSFQKIHPEKMKVVAVAEPNAAKREMARKDYGVPEENIFTSAEELLAQPRLADVMIIATQDAEHVCYAVPALEKGYHILLEKPISPSLEECIKLQKKAHECNRVVVVCHVLRYTQFYQSIKKLLDEGVIGKIETVDAIENVAYWHFAHSYVRGNWRRLDESSPVILAKSCHDMDIIRWLIGKPCTRVTSLGSLDWFKSENAPEGSTSFCLSGCKCKDECPYDCEKIYISNERSGLNGGNDGWPLTVLTDDPTRENLYKAMKEGPYGRCVYHCDNDVADHQTVNMEFEGGTTASFTVSAFTHDCYRYIKIMGSHGEIEGNMDENVFYIRRFGQPVEKVELDPLTDRFAGHGGGDAKMMDYVCELIGGDITGDALTSVDASVESHVMALAAEQSRTHGGEPIVLSDFAKV